MILVDAERISMSRPGRALFTDLSVTVSTGDRLAVVGLNGFGKSTLLRVLTGAVTPETGVVRRSRDLRVAALDQEGPLPEGTVRAAVVGGHDAAWEAEAVLDRLGMSGLLDRDVATLSGGQAKRVALARTLVSPCDLLVLDEPTNHLDLDGIAWLESHLAAFRGGLLLVTHDRHVLDRVTTRILELDRREAFVHDGGYASYLGARAARRDRAEEAERRRRNLARDELRWLRRGAPARRRKPKDRIDAARTILDGAPPPEARPDELDLHVGTPRLGDKVVELHGVGHRYDGGPWLCRDLDLLIDRRERLGIVGPNGSGKSTLLEIVAGRLRPTVGEVRTGPTVRVGYYDQRMVVLDPRVRVREAITGLANPHWRDVALMERFWFDRDAQFSEVELLSGGERRRLQLVQVLRERPNVLLLDEPTNDLDIETLRALEDFLDDWPGALLVASHDRAFLERTVSDVLVLEEGGAARYPGGLAAWEDAWRHRAPRRTRRSGPARPATERPRSRSTLRHRLRAVEAELRPLERRRADLTEQLGVATSDHEALARVGSELSEIEQQVAVLEDRWLELSEELEARSP